MNKLMISRFNPRTIIAHVPGYMSYALFTGRGRKMCRCAGAPEDMPVKQTPPNRSYTFGRIG